VALKSLEVQAVHRTLELAFNICESASIIYISSLYCTGLDFIVVILMEQIILLLHSGHFVSVVLRC
jgi:hypothetical protein